MNKNQKEFKEKYKKFTIYYSASPASSSMMSLITVTSSSSPLCK